MKRKILELLSDYQWHSMASMVRQLNQATSISQRIGDMTRNGIEFDRRMITPQWWEWKLLTKWEDIDLKTCCLRLPKEAECFSPKTQTSKISASSPLQFTLLMFS